MRENLKGVDREVIASNMMTKVVLNMNRDLASKVEEVVVSEITSDRKMPIFTMITEMRATMINNSIKLNLPSVVEEVVVATLARMINSMLMIMELTRAISNTTRSKEVVREIMLHAMRVNRIRTRVHPLIFRLMMIKRVGLREKERDPRIMRVEIVLRPPLLKVRKKLSMPLLVLKLINSSSNFSSKSARRHLVPKVALLNQRSSLRILLPFSKSIIDELNVNTIRT